MTELENKEQSLGLTGVMLGIIALVAAVAALKVTYIVTMPLVFAFFLVMLVRPLQRGMNRFLPYRLKWISVVVSFAVLLGIASIGGYVLYRSFHMFISKSPEYFNLIAKEITDFIQRSEIQEWARQYDIPIRDTVFQLTGITQRVVGLVSTAVTSIWAVAAMVTLIFFFALLMLLEVPEWIIKPKQVFGDKADLVIETSDAIAKKVRQYLVVRTGTSLITAGLSWFWLWLLGVDLAFLWAVLIFLLNYLPYIGSVVSVIPPTIVGLVQFSLAWGGLTLGGLTVIQQVIGNFLDPRLQGRILSVSPVVIMFSVVFWAWVWGVAGAILAVPLTLTIVSTCAHIPALRFLATFMSRPARDKVVLPETPLEKTLPEQG